MSVKGDARSTTKTEQNSAGSGSTTSTQVHSNYSRCYGKEIFIPFVSVMLMGNGQKWKIQLYVEDVVCGDYYLMNMEGHFDFDLSLSPQSKLSLLENGNS